MKSEYFKRPTGRRNLPDQLLHFGRHLVYSEGTKTEPYYINNIKKCISEKYNCRPNEIEIIPVNENGKSFNTIGLVYYAEKDVELRLNNKEKIDHVWIFFDKDNFPEKDYNEADKTLMKKTIRMIII